MGPHGRRTIHNLRGMIQERMTMHRGQAGGRSKTRDTDQDTKRDTNRDISRDTRRGPRPKDMPGYPPRHRPGHQPGHQPGQQPSTGAPTGTPGNHRGHAKLHRSRTWDCRMFQTPGMRPAQLRTRATHDTNIERDFPTEGSIKTSRPPPPIFWGFGLSS